MYGRRSGVAFSRMLHYLNLLLNWKLYTAYRKCYTLHELGVRYVEKYSYDFTHPQRINTCFNNVRVQYVMSNQIKPFETRVHIHCITWDIYYCKYFQYYILGMLVQKLLRTSYSIADKSHRVQCRIRVNHIEILVNNYLFFSLKCF